MNFSSKRIAGFFAIHGFTDVGQGEIIPLGFSYKTLPNGDLRISFTDADRRLVVSVDAEGGVSDVTLLKPDSKVSIR